MPGPWDFIIRYELQFYFCPNQFLGEALSSQIEEHKKMWCTSIVGFVHGQAVTGIFACPRFSASRHVRQGICLDPVRQEVKVPSPDIFDFNTYRNATIRSTINYVGTIDTGQKATSAI